MRCCVLLLLFPYLTHQSYFKKLFADAGVAIHCPSDNRVYIHPITGDLQQCSQQLGNYNESSCPEGTVCERFPILIPGFQDYCCWADSQTTDSENLIIGTTTEVPDELIPFTEPPVIQPMRKLVVTAAPERPDDEDNEDEDYEEPTTKRPRNRKTTTTTTTEEPTTTTKKPSNRRLPRCQNSDDRPLIDFGNRLRDCYHQQCNRGYRCEFNKEIRRFICCGQTSDAMVVPPAGLPYIPQPKPLIPRPYRPRPFGILNDGDEDEDENGCSHNKGCKVIHSGNNQNHKNNNGHVNENEYGYSRGDGNGSGQRNVPRIESYPNDGSNQNNQNNNNQNSNYNVNQNSNYNGNQNTNNNNNNINNNYNNWNENGCPYNQNRPATSTGCPYGPSNRPPPQGINDGCSGNAMQGCGMKGGWNQNGKNNGNNVEQQQLPPPRALPEPQPLHGNNGNGNGNGVNRPQENRIGNGNWGDYDNPYDSKQGNNGGYNQGGYENSQVQRPKAIGGSTWNSGPTNEGNWNGNNNGGNSWVESSSAPIWQGPPPNDQNAWNNGGASKQIGNNWNGPNTENPGMQNKNRWIAVPGNNNQQNGWNEGAAPQPQDTTNGWQGKGNTWENQGDWGQPQPNYGNNAVNTGKKRPNIVPVSSGSSTNVPVMIPNIVGPPRMGNDYDDYPDGAANNKNWGKKYLKSAQPSGKRPNVNSGRPRPFNSWNTGSTGSNKRRASNTEQCPAGSEFREQNVAPKCHPPGSDSCPLSHPRCIPSSSLDHYVCCL